MLLLESILLDERVVESLKERFDYAHELDHRDAEHAASPDDERFLLSVSQRLTEDSLSEIVTKDEYERAAKAAVAAQSWERRLQAEQIRLAYLADAYPRPSPPPLIDLFEYSIDTDIRVRC